MLIRTKALTLAAALTVGLSGCAVFDNEARDKAACDKLSDLLTSENTNSIPVDASKAFITSLEREVLPLASGRFGGQIKDLIDSYKGLESRSIFDQLGGGLDSLYYAGVILEHCVDISSDIDWTQG